ncbi:MAG TPA: GNAT family N-acetyltransferase [Gemmatimonadaceae bacterium]|jgi:GNAT superfamily N-acetyltransferase|nr:GNAT family N-acetyltransferase [Gemmatimonadaceae bacterium]
MRAVSVREAKLDDLDAVVELRLSLLREYGDHPLYGRLHPDARRRAYELYRAQLASANETMFVAELEGDIVGVLRCVDTPSSPLLMPDRYCYVSSAFVRPATRRKGVLTALVDAAERWCDARGITEMRLHNASGVRMAEDTWSALGFEVVEQVRRRATHRPATHHAGAHGDARVF